MKELYARFQDLGTVEAKTIAVLTSPLWLVAIGASYLAYLATRAYHVSVFMVLGK